MSSNFPASDEFIRWAQSLGGMLTKIKGQYGGLPEMIEHPDWDESRNEFALSLVKSLHKQLRKMDSELSSYVKEKFG